MRNLIAEDLLLLLLDDEKGSTPSMWADLAQPLGAAVLAELALDVVAERPRPASDLIGRVGKGLRDALAERLAEDGILQRQDDRVLGLFPRTRWPATSTAREAAVLEQLRLALLQGATPEPRVAALASILSALDRVPATLGVRGAEAREAKRRAKELAKGDWPSKAVSDAIAATMSAVTVATMAGSTTAIVASS